MQYRQDENQSELEDEMLELDWYETVLMTALAVVAVGLWGIFGYLVLTHV